MDWLRSCYSSRWFLFTDSVHTVPGRYYFADSTTPFYAGFHRLGSKNWHDKNVIVEQDLGEDLTASQVWDDGNNDFLNPFPRVAGSDDCIINGESITEAITGAGYWQGFPHECFVQPDIGEIPVGRSQAIDAPSAQLVYAALIELLYNDDRAKITQFFKLWLGNEWNTFFYDPGTPLMEVCVATDGTACVVLVEGTTDFQQFAMQAYYGLGAPENIGIFRTSRFWYDAATWILQCIGNSGVTFDMPRTLVGHSYGAVSAILCGARLRAASPQTATRVLAFASPKPGDTTVPGWLAGDYINFVNDGDIVPCVPFDGPQLAPIIGTIPAAIASAWLQWRYMTKTYLLHGDGSIDINTEPSWPTDLISDSVVNALLGNPIPAVTAHRISTYIARLHLRAPVAGWPVRPALYAFLGF